MRIAVLAAFLIALGGAATTAEGQEAAPQPAPSPVQAPSGAPVTVTVGAYVNDIQQPDFKSNSYAIDLYVWFRWRAPDLDPYKTLEFMNRDAADDSNLREPFYDQPEVMPDGSLYQIIRYRGQFSTKFRFDAYPFDTQTLKVVLEDSIYDVSRLIYVPDGKKSVILDAGITLPGYTVGKPHMHVTQNRYPTNFGDISEPDEEIYSRIVLSIPVTRPVVAMSIKIFLPIILIVVCAALVFFVRPRQVSSRIGLGITALLTLVALELSSGSSLPDIDYLMMLDKIFLLSYLFIIVAIARAVTTSWHGTQARAEKAIARDDRLWFGTVVGAYVAAIITIAWVTLAQPFG
jgi:hypothetical protein